jgi:anti-anti-sigma regulatory factor
MRLAAVLSGYWQRTMLRVTTRTNNGNRLLEVEGDLRDEWVSVLETACSAALADGDRVLLDLANLRRIDAEGVAMLERLPPSVLLLRSTLLLQELLCGEGPAR